MSFYAAALREENEALKRENTEMRRVLQNPADLSFRLARLFEDLSSSFANTNATNADAQQSAFGALYAQHYGKVAK